MWLDVSGFLAVFEYEQQNGDKTMNKYTIDKSGLSPTIRQRITPNEYLEITSWEEEKGRFQKWEIQEELYCRLRKGFSKMFQNKDVFDYWDIRIAGGDVKDAENKCRLWEILEAIDACFTGNVHRFGVFWTLEPKYQEKIGRLQIVVNTGGLHKSKQLFVRAERQPLQPSLRDILGEGSPSVEERLEGGVL